MRGSIYARSYAIDYARIVESLEDNTGAREPSMRRRDLLAEICADRAGVKLGTYHPATNGQVIEQQLVLTTHNLAALLSVEGMAELFRDHWGSLARRCFQWVTEQLQLPDAGYHVGLLRIKNAAYAWRQMVFFISQDASAANGFLEWARGHLEAQPPDFRHRFEPALRRLVLAVRGEELDASGVASAPVFLGWTSDRHWLMAPRATNRSAGRA